MGTRLEKLKKYRVYIVLAPILFFSFLIQSSSEFASLFGKYLTAVIVLIAGMSVLSDVIIKAKDGNQIDEIDTNVKEHREESKEANKIIIDKLDSEIEKWDSKKEEIYEKNSLLIDLINEQLIPIQVVDETIPDKKFVTVFCTAEGFSNNLPAHIKQLKDDDSERYRQFRPDYTKIFEKLQFIQLSGRDLYFIIAEDNIYPEKLRNITKLADYLNQKARLLLDEKWNLIMKDAEINSTTFYKNRHDKNNPLNFNMLLIKSNRRDMRHRFKITNDFNPEFIAELASLSNIEKVKSKIKENDKIEIKKFVLRSSIKILILKIDKKSDQKKILELESTFRKSEEEGGLGIKYFYDYHKKDREDIVKILKKEFSEEEKITEYTNMIIENSKKYKDDLIKLGIDLSE